MSEESAAPVRPILRAFGCDKQLQLRCSIHVAENELQRPELLDQFAFSPFRVGSELAVEATTGFPKRFSALRQLDPGPFPASRLPLQIVSVTHVQMRKVEGVEIAMPDELVTGKLKASFGNNAEVVCKLAAHSLTPAKHSMKWRTMLERKEADGPVAGDQDCHPNRMEHARSNRCVRI